MYFQDNRHWNVPQQLECPLNKLTAVLAFAASSIAPVAFAVVSASPASAVAPATICNFGGIPKLAMAEGLSPSSQAPGHAEIGPMLLRIDANGDFTYKALPPAFTGWQCVEIKN